MLPGLDGGLLLGQGDRISVIGGGDTDVVASDTTVSPTFHANTAEGDECFAFVMRRSAVTPPSGWMLVAEQQGSSDHGAVDQWLSVYRKTYAASDGSGVTFTQSASGRMVGHVVTVRSPTGSVSVADSGTGTYSAASTNPGLHPIQGVTGTAAGQVVLSGSACTFSAVPPALTSYAAPAGWTQTTPASIEDNRMLVAWKAAPVGAAASGTHQHGADTHAAAEISLLLSAA